MNKRPTNHIEKKKKALFIVLSVSLSTLAVLFMWEMGLRLVRPALLDYDATWSKPPVLGRGGYLQPNFDGFVLDGLGGRVRWHNNGDGFRNNREFGPFPPSSTIRIISMGDSFTVGYRVSYEEIFSVLLEKWVTETGTPAEVMIPCIEEPATGLSWLQKFGVEFHPDIVLLGLTLGNDIAQSYIALNPTPVGFRHGLENYLIPDRCLRRPLSWWNRLEIKFARGGLFDLRLVNLFRDMIRPPNKSPQFIASWNDIQSPQTIYLFDAHNGLGMYIKEPPEEIREAYRRLFRILMGFKTFTDKHKMAFVVMLFPQRYQIQPQDWNETVRLFGLKTEAFDLDAPNRRISAFCKEQSILVIDPTEQMRKEWGKKNCAMYLPHGDMHWNSNGHGVFFSSVCDKITEVVRLTANRKSQSLDGESPMLLQSHKLGEFPPSGANAR